MRVVETWHHQKDPYTMKQGSFEQGSWCGLPLPVEVLVEDELVVLARQAALSQRRPLAPHARVCTDRRSTNDRVSMTGEAAGAASSDVPCAETEIEKKQSTGHNSFRQRWQMAAA